MLTELGSSEGTVNSGPRLLAPHFIWELGPIVLGVQFLGEGVTEGMLGVLCSVAVMGFDSHLRKGISYHET